MKLFRRMLSVITIIALAVFITGGTFIEGEDIDHNITNESSDEQTIQTDATIIPDYSVYGIKNNGEDIEFSEMKVINCNFGHAISARTLASMTGFDINYNSNSNELLLTKHKKDGYYQVIKFYPNTYEKVNNNYNFCYFALKTNNKTYEFVNVPMVVSSFMMNDTIYISLEETLYLMGYQFNWDGDYIDLIDEYLIKIQYYETNENLKRIYPQDIYTHFFFDYRWGHQVSQETIDYALNYEEDNSVFTYNVFTKSNLSVKQLNKILHGTGLQGKGELFYNMEQNYNVNALFCLSVGSLESGNFTSSAFRNKNNPFGIGPGKYFNSVGEAINYFGNLMNKKTYYGKSIDSIGAIYCVGGNWANKVKALMKTNWYKL